MHKKLRVGEGSTMLRMTKLRNNCATPEGMSAMSHELRKVVSAIREAIEPSELRLMHLLIEHAAVAKVLKEDCIQAIPECVIDAMKNTAGYRQHCFNVIIAFNLEHNITFASTEERALIAQICAGYCRIMAHSAMYSSDGNEHKVSEVANLALYRNALDMQRKPAYELCEELAQHPTQNAAAMIACAKDVLISEACAKRAEILAQFDEAHKNCCSSAKRRNDA